MGKRLLKIGVMEEEIKANTKFLDQDIIMETMLSRASLLTVSV